MSREVVEDMLMCGIEPAAINAVYEMGRKSMKCHQHGENYVINCDHCNDVDEAVYDLCRASDILAMAASEMNDRAATYDQPQGERSMGKTVAAFAAVTGVHMTEQQGWQFMELLKMVRSNQGGYRADSFVDGAAYASLAGEAAAREKEKGA